MNNKIIVSILMTSLLLKATPPQESKPTGSFQGGTQALPWLLGAAVVTGGGHWAYNRWFSQKQPFLKEQTVSDIEKWRLAQKNFIECFRANRGNTMNQYQFPTACEETALAVGLAREAIEENYVTLTTKTTVAIETQIRNK